MSDQRHGFHLLYLVALLGGMLALVGSGHPQYALGSEPSDVALAYVWGDVVTLADADGTPLNQPGPSFEYGTGARLFWSADADTLYIARNDALFATDTVGGAAVSIARGYGRTLAISQDESAIYYLDTSTPQAVVNEDDPNAQEVAFPLRTIAFDTVGGTGRMVGYYGRFNASSASADIAFAAALYARDGGLLGPGRPHLWPTYGASVFGTCCFPEPGLGLLDTRLAEFSVFDAEFITAAAAVNLTHTHLAGPTTTGAIRIIDLITGGTRDYIPEIGGSPLLHGITNIERIAWSPDDTHLYIIVREDPSTPLELTTETSFPADLRSADVTLYRLNLVTSALTELAYRQNVYGVSSLAATDRYIFATVVDPNTALITALNARQVRPGSSPTDEALAQYWPATHLWRVDLNGETDADILDDVWGVAARPIR